MATIPIDELSSIIEEELADYLDLTVDHVRQVVDEVTQEAVQELKDSSPRKSGRYARGWTSKIVEDSPTGVTKVIHNRVASLTHLLENGHATRGGGRVAGIRHIAPVEEKAILKIEKGLREKL
ncbi:HK97 gp10 family phage protein [Streptococcus suis]